MSKFKMVTGILCAFIVAAMPQAVQAQKQVSSEELAKMKPSATITMDEEEIRLLLGGDKGKGVLTFQGKKYPFTIKGLTAGGIGIQKVHASGNVYFLKKVEDFTGKYTELTAGATAAKGVGTASFQNNRGVYMSVKERSTGLALSLGIGVMDVQLAK